MTVDKKRETIVGAATPSAPAGKSRLPLPTGSIQIKKLSPIEKKRLEQLGWDGQNDLPENFAAIAEAALQATTGRSASQLRAAASGRADTPETEDDMLQELQARAGRGFQRVAAPPETNINDLPAEQQAEYRRLLNNMLQQHDAEKQAVRDRAGLPESVAAAVQEASQSATPVVDDRQSPQYASGADKTPVEAPKHTGQHCARCGYPKDQFYDIPITDEEKDQYLLSALHLRPLEADTTLFGGRLQLRWRALSVEDNEDIWRQLLLDEASGFVSTAADKMEYSQRYRLTLSLIQYETDDNITRFQGELAKWNPSVNSGRGKLWDCWSVLREILKLNESTYRVLAGEQLKFSMKLMKLEQLADDVGFWKAGGNS